MMPYRESDRNAIPIEVAAAAAAATSTFVPPLRYPARTVAATAAEGRFSPRWPHMASLGPRVSPFEFEGMVQDTPPPLSLSVLLDDEFRAPTPAVVVPDRATIDRRRARMLRHKQKIALHEAEDAVAAAVVPHTIAEASRPDARLSLPGLRNGGDLPHLDHQMMLELEEHQSLAVPTTRRSDSDFEEEDLRKSIADIFAEDRSREHISSSSDRDRDRDRERRRKYRHSRHSSHSSRNRGEEESREYREYNRENRDSKRRSHESQGSNYRRSVPDSGGSRPGSGSSKLDTPPRTPRRRNSGVVGEVPVSSSRRYRTPEEQEAHEQRKAQRRAAREAERLEKQEVHVNESGYEWYQGHERYGLPERHYERRERREHYDFRDDRDYRGVDRSDRRDRHERPEQTQRPEPLEHPEPVSSREVPEEVYGRPEKYDRRERQDRRERRRERREAYGKTLASEPEPAVFQPAMESLESPPAPVPAPAPAIAPALAPALVSADVPAAPERKGKEVGFDLPPEEIKRHRSRSFRQRSSNTGYSRDDLPRQPSPEKRFFGMRNTEGIVRKSSSPPPQDRYTYVPTRDASLPEDMRPRTRDRDIPRTRDRRMSEGTYDRPRRSRIEDPPRQSGPLEEGDDAARRARHERRRMKEAKEQEKKSGGLRGVFKRLFN